VKAAVSVLYLTTIPIKFLCELKQQLPKDIIIKHEGKEAGTDSTQKLRCLFRHLKLSIFECNERDSLSTGHGSDRMTLLSHQLYKEPYTTNEQGKHQ
jgi:hypothetical protein